MERETRNVYYDGILTSTNRDGNKHSAETLQEENTDKGNKNKNRIPETGSGDR